METKREGKVGVVGVSKASFSAPLEAEKDALLRSTLRGEARLGSTEIEDSTEEHERASTIICARTRITREESQESLDEWKKKETGRNPFIITPKQTPKPDS